ncbi:MAG: hypothetical protein DRP65_01715 [Planctomycetota bacterium]|nr:MAG: hypothetical protein DRP65_01715 [Planctomycetota bacterium]
MHGQFGLVEKKRAAFADKHEPDAHGGHSNLRTPVDATVKLPQERKQVEGTTGKQRQIKNEKMGEKFERRREKYKIATMAVLLAGACLLTYYFHVVLDRGTLLTHLFYIPIGLAAFWWKRKGIFVALFLATMLLLSHKFLRVDVVAPFHDYFRIVMLLITSFVIAMLSEKLSKTKALNKRVVKELSCLCDLSRLAEQRDIALDVILQEVIGMMQNSWRYPDITCVRAIVGDKEFKTENFKETRWKQSVDIKTNGRKAGTLEVYYLEQRRQVYEGPFLKEERDLIEAVAEHLGMIIHRKQAEEALQKSESDKELILSSISELMVYQDKDFRVVWANKVAADSVGQAVNELTGRYCYEVWCQRNEPCPDCPVQKSIETGRLQEKDVSTPDGRIWHIRGYPVRDQSGNVAGAVEVTLDITERKRAEEKLRFERDKLITILDSMADGVYIVNQQNDIEYVNPVLVKDFGTYEGRKCYEYFHDRTEVCPWCKRPDVFAGKTVQWEWYSAKSQKTYDIIDTPLRNADGSISKLKILRDITERKQTTEKLKLLSSAVEQAGEGIAVIDMQGNILSANDAFSAMHDYTKEELIGKHCSILHTAEQMPSVEAANREIKEKGWFSGEIGHVHRNGRVFPTWVQNSLLRDEAGNPVGIICTLRDITQLKLAERKVRLDESRLQSLLTLSQMTEAPVQEITDFALESAVELTSSQLGYIAFMNEDETSLTMHSWSKEAVAQCRIADKPMVHPVGTTGLWGEAVRQRKPVITNNYAADNPLKKGCPEGHVDIIRHMNIPVFDNGRIVAVAGVGNKYEEYDESDVRQLTLLMQDMWKLIQRKRVEKKLQDSESRFRELFENMSSGVAIYEAENEGRDFIFKDFNRRGQEIDRIDKKDLIGRRVTEVFPGVEEIGLLDVFRKVWKTGQPEHHPVSQYKDSRVAGWRENFVYKLPSGEIVAIYDDVTESKQAEEQVRQSRRELERISRIITVGELASGLTHELNQPLCAIANYADGCLRMIRTGTVSPGKLLAAIEQIATQADRGGKITQHVRSLVGRGEPHLSTVDINKIIRDVVSLEVAQATQAGVAVRLELAEDIPLILADRIEIEQVVLNLAKNGIEAMSDTAIDRRQLTIQTSTAGSDAVQVAVCDTGKGLPPEGADKIFDSFFTTKPDGLGMGLSISHSIIEAHGGNLWAEPNPDAGTTFRFTLPLKGKENG